MLNQWITEFENPTSQYRGKPFWSWNGKLEKEELLRQLQIMKQMGFGGFFMHSRTGLQTKYLGEEWFDCINTCADEAEKLGMEAWLYDEDRWPSGIAGGRVTANPEYRMKSVKLTVENSTEFKWKDNMLAVFSCRLEGASFYDCKRMHKETPRNEYLGLDILVFTVVEMASHNFYNGFTYVDTLNRKATERFIELTHEKYKEKCGQRLGRSIKGIFTDEPHRGSLMSEFGAGNEEDIYRVPWTNLFTQEFMKQYGYDLVEKLPELFLKKHGELVSQVKWHYVELIQQMFLDNFAKPIHEWCINNNIILTGHVLHEDSLTAQTAMNGSVMRYYEYMEYPGVDVLTEGNKNFWIVKQLSSAARQLGKKMLVSELYGCTGWQMNFEGHKAVGDWQALLGINLRCHHLSWYTMEGESKRDYPASILHQSAWWKEYKYVEDYFSRIGIFMSQGEPCCEVLVLNPVESVWCQVYPGYTHMLDAKSHEVIELEENYRNIFTWLMGAHIDFDYGDEDMISRLYSIEFDRSRKPLLRIGQAVYSVVVVAGMLTLRSSTLIILKEFICYGGSVIFAGNPPAYVDAIASEEAVKLTEDALVVGLDKESLIGALRETIGYPIEVVDEEGTNIEDIYCQMRTDGENRYLMLLNINREKAYAKSCIRVNLAGCVEEWICSTGERFNIKTTNSAGCTEIQTSFEPGGEHLYLMKSKEPGDIPYKIDLTDRESYLLTGPYEYELEEPNICVLDLARYKMDDGEWMEESEILKIDRAARAKLGLPLRGGEMIQPWFAQKDKKAVKCKLSLEFTFFIQDMPEDGIKLVMETPESFSISINDQMLKTPVLQDFWIDKCFDKLSLNEDLLKIGRNNLQLQVDFHEDINLEGIYLIGAFGVDIEGNAKTIKRLPQKINAGNLALQGLPFYTGKICYRLKLDQNMNKGKRIFLSLNEFEGACAKLIAKNNYEKMIAWWPYEVEIPEVNSDDNILQLEIVLTRRNTFGPLHQLPVREAAYGPFSFITEGDQFTNDYVLLPSGLLKEPKITIR